MKPAIQLPNDPFSQQQRQQAAQQAYVQQFVAETARELFVKDCECCDPEQTLRDVSQGCIRAARIFAEEALGIRFEENT